MRNIWLVAQHELITNIRKKSFLFAVFGIPLLMVGVFALVFAIQTAAMDSGIVVEQIGYIDQAEIIDIEAPLFLPFRDEAAAQDALKNGEIDFYIIIPANYLSTANVQVYATGNIPEATYDDIELFLVDNLLGQVESDAPAERLIEPMNMEIYLESSQKQVSEWGFAGLLAAPFVFATVLIMALQLSSTFLMSGVVEEKSNHVMEILITSISPYQLLTGKLLGLGVLGLLQMVVWLGIGFALASFGGQIEWLSGISVPPDFIILALIYFLLTYFLYSSILAGIGAVVGSEQESRTIAGIVSLFLSLPYFFIALLLTDPTSGIFTFFLFFPLTSAMAYMLLYPFVSIPLWYLGLSLGILAVSTLLVTWAAARVFRWALLLSGKLPNPLVLWRVIRGKQEIGTLPNTSKKKEGAA